MSRIVWDVFADTRLRHMAGFVLRSVVCVPRMLGDRRPHGLCPKVAIHLQTFELLCMGDCRRIVRT